MFALALGASLLKSPAVGEAGVAVGGWARLHGETVPLADRPALPSLLGGAGLLLEPDLPAPASLEGMAEGDLARSGTDLFWGHGLSAGRLILLARFSFILLGLLLAATAYRWAADLYGPWAALLALMLLALAPGILTFTALALPDMVLAAFYVMALFAGWRFTRSGGWRWLALAGVLSGLALASGPIAALLLPSLLLVLAAVPPPVPTRLPRPLRSRLVLVPAAFLLLALIALVVLWAALGFPWQPFPLAGYLEQLIDLFRWGVIEGHVYFNGMFSPTGWWFYQPLVYLIKTPVPALLVVLPAIIFALVRGVRRVELSVLIPLLLYTALMLLPRFNGGYRLLLPMVLLLSVFAARLVTVELPLRWVHPTLAGLMTLSSLAINILAYPDYLGFIDRAFGGTFSALSWLGGADLDLGQDLPALARFLEQRGAAAVYLSYYGEADPAYYGIDAALLPGPPADEGEGAVGFYPLNPAPGLYAISVSNLAGLRLTDPDWFGYFRGRPPLAQVGSSIYIYEVQPDTLPTAARTTPWSAVCAVPTVPESAGRLIDLTGIEGLLFLYFDCGQGLAFPAGPGWLLLPAGIDPVLPLGAPDYVARHPDGSPRYSVWLSRGAPPPPASTIEFPAVDLPLPVAGYVELLGYQVDDFDINPGDTLHLLVWWRVRALPPSPVSFSAQMLTLDNALIASADGLGVPVDEWQPGMTIVQRHSFEIGPDVPPGDYVLTVGMYVPTTGRRFPIYQSGAREIDRIVLRGITVGPSR
ncbi:MAG: hypothetical protein Kow00124_10110 [Anaerolineae bacterium]